MNLAMTAGERSAFLRAHTTGVMVVQSDPELFAMPVWYDYEPGGTIGFVVNEGSRRLAAIDRPGCVLGLTVHDESRWAPAFVTAFGSVVVNREMDPGDLARVWPTMVEALGGEDVATRYVQLGGDAWVRGVQPSGSRRIEMRPERWTSCDYAKAGDTFRQVMTGSNSA